MDLLYVIIIIFIVCNGKMQTIVLEMLEWSVNSKLGSSPVSPFRVIPRKILINLII